MMYNFVEVNNMDEKDVEFAVKCYKKNKKKNPEYTYDQFLQDIIDHKARRPIPHNFYDIFSLKSNSSTLWQVLEMSMKDLVGISKLDMAKFSRRFVIPYRTLQSWCDGTNPCPIYVKLILAELLGVYKRTITMNVTL